MSDRWPALTLVMRAPARLDISSCSASGITLSCVPMSDQDGIDFHAGGPEGSVNCASFTPRALAPWLVLARFFTRGPHRTAEAVADYGGRSSLDFPWIRMPGRKPSLSRRWAAQLRTLARSLIPPDAQVIGEEEVPVPPARA